MKRLLFFAVVGVMVDACAVELVTAEEVHAREGVGNFVAKLEGGRPVTVAYLGGSITEMSGWRNMTTDWMRKTWPKAKVTEVPAAIGGTGSGLGVFRLEHDALAKNPDLLFVEFATNDANAPAEAIWRNFDGIVQQTWAKNPRTDIVFVYTITSSMMKNYGIGKMNPAASAMEKLADHYGIPSVCFGPRVAAEVKAGRLVMSIGEVATAVPKETPDRDRLINEELKKKGQVLFAKDGVHPALPGHAFYLQSIVSAFEQMRKSPSVDHGKFLGKPFFDSQLAAAKMVPIDASMLKGEGWTKLSPDSPEQKHFSGRGGQFYRADRPRARLVFRFRGTRCDIYDLLAPNGANVRVSVDGKVVCAVCPRFDSYCWYTRLATLPVYCGKDGVHDVEIEVLEKQPDRTQVKHEATNTPKYDGTLFQPCQIMLVGELLSDTANLPETPLIGTVGTGHAFPGPCRPFGLVQPSPDTGNGNWKYCSGYSGEDRVIRRFSQTHLNGTGQAGLGDVGILPFCGNMPSDPDEIHAPFRKENERAVLGKYEVRLDDGTFVEIAAGRRLAHYRLTFPKGAHGKVLLDFPYGLYRQEDYLPLLTTSCRVARVSASRLEGANHSEVFAPRDVYYVVALSPEPVRVEELPCRTADKGPRYVAEFAADAAVEVKIALSSRSLAGARKNFVAEESTDFDRRVRETVSEWEGYLSRVDLSGRSAEEKRTITAALYHLFIQPNIISDVDEKPRYSTFSLWDTFRDAHPLYEKLVPELVVPFIESLLDHYDRWGYLPRWELWGRETNCMIGSHAVPVIVSCWQHGFRGFDVEKAYAAVRATLTDEERPGAGRVYPRRTDWKVYDRYGYFPYDLVPRESVSRTLECSIDDFHAAQFARALGRVEDADFFERRSWNFTNIFDRTTLCFRGRDSRGNWREPFDPASATATPDYTEGSALQYSWHVLHRPEWLVNAMGGAVAFEERLDKFFAGALFPGSRRDRTQDITGLIGDYAHGNEPCHHVPGLYRLVGRPDKEQAIVRRILCDFYRPAADGLCGNDDCGQMSAWYLRRRCDIITKADKGFAR